MCVSAHLQIHLCMCYTHFVWGANVNKNYICSNFSTSSTKWHSIISNSEGYLNSLERTVRLRANERIIL